ncbi:DinB family protein [Paenibacillus sp. CAA11]|uniref:DinB family protein n=1 Tax=Paenibacillus sp. CAA11 TaxID=1532905 RepID=UPI003FA3C5A5
MFQYNWKVREEWFELCKQIPAEELVRRRVGGAGSMLYTLFHIADVEYSWVRAVQGKPDIEVDYEHYKDLARLKQLSDGWKAEVREFLKSWNPEDEEIIVTVPWSEERYTQGEILRHVIAHEIHHMGQMSLWARELGFEPVSANVIGRECNGLI